MKKPAKYRFSPTLLDSFSCYLNASKIYNEIWGNSENPNKTEDEFEQEQYQQLINRINKVPIDWENTEAIDKGTAFNEVIDCMILEQNSNKMKINKVFFENKISGIEAVYNNRAFVFPIDLCRDFSTYLKNAIPQVYVEGVLETKYGEIELHGYIDELLPFKVVDIKTTNNYKAFKYRDYWQRIVYPFLLNQNGNTINDFEFVVTDFKRSWVENYTYNENEDIPKLTDVCERFIEFIEANNELITREWKSEANY